MNCDIFYATEASLYVLRGEVASDMGSWCPIPKGARKGLNIMFVFGPDAHVGSKSSEALRRFLAMANCVLTTLRRNYSGDVLDRLSIKSPNDVCWNACEFQKYVLRRHLRTYVLPRTRI